MKNTKRILIDSPSFFVGQDGDGLISFGSGQPDLPPPEAIYHILPTYRAFKYGLIQGQENLRGALSKQYPGSTPGDFVITNGASEAIDLVFRVIASKKGKKKVLLQRPYYYSYPFNVKFAGLQPVFTDLREGRIDLGDFKKKIKDCVAVLINSPSNPTGRVEAISTLKEIERITQKLGVYVVSDEVYKDLIYERENYLLRGPHVLTINSFSKTYAMCGLRVGYLYSRDREMTKAVVDMKVHTSMNTSIIAQEMAYEATKTPRTYVDQQVAIWKARRDLIYQGLVDMGLDLWKPEGAFYVLPKIPKIKNLTSNKVVNDLYYRYRVIVYDGAWFGVTGRIRLSYALDVKKISEGLLRIQKYFDGLR